MQIIIIKSVKSQSHNFKYAPVHKTCLYYNVLIQCLVNLDLGLPIILYYSVADSDVSCVDFCHGSYMFKEVFLIIIHH